MATIKLKCLKMGCIRPPLDGMPGCAKHAPRQLLAMRIQTQARALSVAQAMVSDVSQKLADAWVTGVRAMVPEARAEVINKHNPFLEAMRHGRTSEGEGNGAEDGGGSGRRPKSGRC